MFKTIKWNGFIDMAMEEYPKEVCGFLFTDRPYNENETWHIYTVTNTAPNPEDAWYPDLKEMKTVKQMAKDTGLIKIGNVHSHPSPKIWHKIKNEKLTARMVNEVIQPSEIDIKQARKARDIVRCIIVVDKRNFYGARFHDMFNNEISIETFYTYKNKTVSEATITELIDTTFKEK
jgi:proteasome lid subunit RPN8/RPN11